MSLGQKKKKKIYKYKPRTRKRYLTSWTEKWPDSVWPKLDNETCKMMMFILGEVGEEKDF